MNNPQTSLTLTPHIIFDYDNHKNIPWNDPEYQPVREYIDPRKQATERKYLQTPKGGKDLNYVTKRGFYMDYHIKVGKGFPSPVDHKLADPFDQTINKKKSVTNKLDKSLSKYTYLDLIQVEQKNRASPAPGSYNLNRTQQELEKQKKQLKTKKRFQGNKHFFYQDFQSLSSIHPGMGTYNPHIDVPHLKINNTNHKFWIQKHKKDREVILKRKSVSPAPGTHTPIPLQYSTFDRIKTADETSRKKKDRPTDKGFGTDTKFTYDRPLKKKILEERPSPNTHNLILEWKGKNTQPKASNWMRTRSTGHSRSIYY